ncbi:23S rRNA (guanosine(2251)-2'-O)-methyltransferase RlmB [Candidatus Dojkabacteria bacterium]|nr:23S rRNA (guanosine(2251)-2'-O)-methyltransferase RlmB [Candidatus Dojkabacteria bacterium]
MKIEGRNPVIESLRSKKIINKVYIQNNINIDEKIREIINSAKSKSIELSWVNKSVLDKLSETQSHQGVIADVDYSKETKLEDLIDFNSLNRFIFIRDAHHTHNIGAIIRTAECAGYDAVILPPKIKITPDIIRASMGASEHIPILHYSLFQLIKDLKKQNFKIYGIERSNNAIDYSKITYEESFLLIIGGEDKSLTPEIFERCDQTLLIPMFGKVNSLNMSVAAAIVIFKSIENIR